MNGPKHVRLRYYTSLEEALLLRLWREHLPNIPSYSENLPIFRDISHGIQRHGIRLNKQEVRRRINSYRNKYLSERARVEGNPEYRPEWRLYPLIDCLLAPSSAPVDPHLAQSTVEAAASRERVKHPELPSLLRISTVQLKFERDAEGCAFLEDVPATDTAAVKVEAKPTTGELDAFASPVRAPLAPANHQLLPATEELPGTPLNGQAEAAKRRRGRRGILPRAGQVTRAMVEALKEQNELLRQQNATSLLALEQKELQMLAMERNFMAFLHRQEAMLTQLAQDRIKEADHSSY
ncbi:hypothetical protein KR018_001005 [Drosophila ironensis]|nr:hypothetical protein KR018_001005 [Drosophila ironensis]